MTAPIAGVVVMRAFNQRVTAAGRRICDVLAPSGEVIRGCPIASQAGIPISIPLEGEVPLEHYKFFPPVLVGVSSQTRRPVVLGGVEHPRIQYVPPEDNKADDFDVDDDLSTASLEEVHLRAAGDGGSYMALRLDGRAVVRGKVISLQVEEGGYVRLSQGGDSEGRIPVLTPLVEYINELVDKVNSLHAAVTTIQTRLAYFEVTSVNTQLAIPGTPPVPFPLQGFMSILPTPALTDTPAVPLDESSVASSTVRISGKIDGSF